MKWKIITAFLIITVLSFTSAILISHSRLQQVEEFIKIKVRGCKNLSKNEGLKSIAINVKSKLITTNLDGLNHDQKQNKIDNLLADFNIDSFNINDLSEIKWIYHELYVGPRLDDDITDGIDRIIKNKIDRIIEISVRGKKYSPTEMYIVTLINPNGYQCRLENGYADDSFHLSEFPENCDPILYNELDVFSMNLDNNFRFAVKPHIYSSHSGAVLKLKNWDNNKFNLPSKLSHAVLFSIIEEKNITRRKYKVFWLVNYDKQSSCSFNSRAGSTITQVWAGAFIYEMGVLTKSILMLVWG